MKKESKFMAACYKLTDIVILNVLFCLCCIPVFTIGAAGCALYAVMLRMCRDEEGSVVGDYFRAFKNNFRQATVLWLIMLAFGVFLYVDFRIAAVISSDIMRSFYFGLMIALLLVFLSMLSYLFPMVAWFENKNLQMIKNSLRIAGAYLKYTFPILVLNLTPLLALFVSISSLKWIIAAYLIFWFSAVAYFNSRMLRVLFDELEK